MIRGFVLTILGLCVAFILLNTAMWTLEVPIHLGLGWLWHSGAVLPNVTINASGVGLFAVALLVTALLAHGSARWLWTGLGNTSAWRAKWTAIGLAGVMLMFTAGIAATGVVHQTGWLIRSPVPLVQSGPRAPAYQRRCASNLRQLATVIALYAGDHAGQRPPDLATLIRAAGDDDATPDIFVCSASNDELAPGTRPTDWVPLVAAGGHLSYVYCPEPISGPFDADRVSMYEPLANHDDGLNLLYEDGRVDWVNETVAEAWLKRVSATQPTTATTR